ncbi:OLC1v1015561C1 [Oldenlandia corymbosa var. corymbosa]|nr:OLC1v1015561C1 [Oldenlandia corymbosa var. corymbosa]
MQSVRMEACDCPPSHHTVTKGKIDSCVLPGQRESRKDSTETAGNLKREHTSSGERHQIAEDEDFSHCQESSNVKQGDVIWGKNKSKKRQSQNAVKKVSQVKENSRGSVQESEKYRTVKDDGFLRVLFWQFHQFRMLLGSDLLIFSNEKYVAVSLHLWDVSRQVTPLTWLEAWLDNVMASVPELAICYHQDGVVQGYELLKTDDIFLLKGISEDGTPAFHPHVVHQNGLSVLRFLQENCKQDPGAYWLYKGAGEDLIQIFDLTMMPKNHSPDDCDNVQSSLPSLMCRGRSDSVLSLGTLLYRIAHRLSLSMSSDKRSRCVDFLRKCLDFLDEPDHLVVRAFAHEQFARLLLNHDKELDFTSEVVPTDYEVTLNDAEEDSVEVIPVVSEEETKDPVSIQCLEDEDSATNTLDADTSPHSTVAIAETNLSDSNSSGPRAITDPITSKLAAIHHVSQAIKSIRWKRQLQTTEVNMDDVSSTHSGLNRSLDFCLCACGDPDCIEVCDLYEWLPTAKLDDKVWKLVLLLGESYLALGQAYKDDGQLFQALKVVELACLVYGSMPQHLEETRFISSMVCSSPNQMQITGGSEKSKRITHSDYFTLQLSPPDYLFWAKAWILVGDVYVELYSIKGREALMKSDKKSFTRELRMSSEVLKEVERLKKKLGEFGQNCSSCSLVNCSCMSDRVNSGSSASSSSGNVRSSAHGKKTNKKSFAKNNVFSQAGKSEDDQVNRTVERSGVLKGDKSGISGSSSTEKADAFANGMTATSTGKGGVRTGKARIGGPGVDSQDGGGFTEMTEGRDGGIFKYIRTSVVEDGEYNLSVALDCYAKAKKALGGNPSCSGELKSINKKTGWVCNELGRSKLDRGDLDGAEHAFADAIKFFKEVSDYTNIILINCNLGHGRRALAEEMVPRLETFKKHPVLHNAYKQTLETAKLKYSEALMYYGAAKLEIETVESADFISDGLKDQVYTQFANTYLRLGILLSGEGTTAEVYENAVLEDHTRPIVMRHTNDYRKHEITANDAIREALSVYESLGDLRKQEAAYAYYQLASYQKDCCLKFLDSNSQSNNASRGDCQKMKQYASLADRNWKKSMDFYRPETHPSMYLTIVMERSALPLTLGNSLHSLVHLESALIRLLDGRHLSGNDSFSKDNPEVCAKFWNQLRMLLKKMLSTTLPIPNKSGEVAKLKELYRMALKSSEFNELHAIHSLWTS